MASEVAVDPEILYGWAAGPVDALADDMESAKSVLDTDTSGAEEARGTMSTARAIANIVAPDGGWGKDVTYLRGRVYDFAEALVQCGNSYETQDTANASGLDSWFTASYGDGNEPTELGTSERYQD